VVSATADEVDELAAVLAEAYRKGIKHGGYSLAREILTAGYRRVPTDEGHVIEFREDGWTISHPLACRPKLFECQVNRVAERDLTQRPDALGRFECELNDIGDRLLIGDRIEVSS
jgi:hypothetical protein